MPERIKRLNQHIERLHKAREYFDVPVKFPGGTSKMIRCYSSMLVSEFIEECKRVWGRTHAGEVLPLEYGKLTTKRGFTMTLYSDSKPLSSYLLGKGSTGEVFMKEGTSVPRSWNSGTLSYNQTGLTHGRPVRDNQKLVYRRRLAHADLRKAETGNVTRLAETKSYSPDNPAPHKRDKPSDHRRLASSPHATTSTRRPTDQQMMDSLSHTIDSRLARLRLWRRRLLSTRQRRDRAAHEYADQMVSRHRNMLTDARIRKDTFLARRKAARCDEARRRLGANLDETKRYSSGDPANCHEACRQPIA